MRDGRDADSTQYEQDTLPRVMLLLIGRWIPRVARMSGILAYNETSRPLLTSDNPAVTWKRVGEGFICGVDQYDPELVVSCPLSPTLMFTAYQTPESLRAVLAEPYDGSADPKPWNFTSRINIGGIPEWEVERMNHICVTNAHGHVYANYRDNSLLRFLENRFFGAAAPVRRRDLRAIGSPIGNDQEE
jgi:hypothetical protein